MLAAFEDATAVEVRRVKLKPRALCPHCLKVVTGKRHLATCEALTQHTDAGCKDCGAPVRGKSWRCEPCKKEALRESFERYHKSAEGRAAKRRHTAKNKARQKARHALWRRTERGKASLKRFRRKFYVKNT